MWGLALPRTHALIVVSLSRYLRSPESLPPRLHLDLRHYLHPLSSYPRQGSNVVKDASTVKYIPYLHLAPRKLSLLGPGPREDNPHLTPAPFPAPCRAAPEARKGPRASRA